MHSDIGTLQTNKSFKLHFFVNGFFGVRKEKGFGEGSHALPGELHRLSMKFRHWPKVEKFCQYDRLMR